LEVSEVIDLDDPVFLELVSGKLASSDPTADGDCADAEDL
jgi:hypothetical protein